MSVVLAVDPGKNASGAAVFDCGRLVDAALVRRAPAPRGVEAGDAAAAAVMAALIVGRLVSGRRRVDEIAVEWPRVYASRIRAGASAGDPNDLLTLAGVDAALAALLAPAGVYQYAPSDWKGQIPKPRRGEQYVVETRARDRLDAAELVVVARGFGDEPASLRHNAWDAVGIGLHHVGRFVRHRVIPT